MRKSPIDLTFLSSKFLQHNNIGISRKLTPPHIKSAIAGGSEIDASSDAW